MEEREKLIERIVKERGNSAVPKLVDLLFTGDSRTAELASEALERLDSCGEIIKKIEEEIESGRHNVGIFYGVDLLGDLQCSHSVEMLYKVLGIVNDEREAIIVYGALLKFGIKEAENYLLYEFEEDPYMKDYLIDIGIALKTSDNPKVFKSIVEKSRDVPDLVEVLQAMCYRNPSFFQMLPEELKEKVNSSQLKGRDTSFEDSYPLKDRSYT